MSRSTVSHASLLFGGALLVACPAGEPQEVPEPTPAPDEAAPALEIAFPAGYVATDLPSLQVVGAAVDETSSVVVSVNGVTAALEDGGFVVPTDAGPLVVTATDEEGNAARFEGGISQVTSIDKPFSAALDPASGRIHTIDIEGAAVRWYDPSTGTGGTVASDSVDDDGLPFTSPLGIAQVPGGPLLVTTREPGRLLAVDPDSGARTLLHEGSFTNPNRVVVLDAETAVVADNDPDTQQGMLWTVDLVSGDVALLTDDTTTTPFPLWGLTAMAWDEANQRLIVANRNADVVGAIDPVDGTRTVLSGAGIGDGPALVQNVSIDLSADGATAWSWDVEAVRIVTIDLLTGDRTLLYEPDVDDPVQLRDVRQLLPSPDGSSLYALDSVNDALVSVDLTSGLPTLLLSNVFPEGTTPFEGASEALWDDAGRRWLVAAGEEIVAIDPSTGARTQISATQMHLGPAFGWIESMALSADGARAWSNEEGGELIEIDLATGTRQLCAGADRGEGPTVQWVNDIERVGDTLYVVDIGQETRVLAIDPATGDREEISGEDRGEGVDPAGLRSIVKDPGAERLLGVVITSGGSSLIGIDLATGDRTELADLGALGVQQPWRVAVSPDGAWGLVADRTLGVIWSIDLATGVGGPMNASPLPGVYGVWVGTSTGTPAVTRIAATTLSGAVATLSPRDGAVAWLAR